MKKKQSLRLMCAVALLPLLWNSRSCPAAPASASPATASTTASTTASATILAPLRPVHLWAPVQDKNFYLLSLLEKTPGLPAVLASDEVLKRLASAHTAKLVLGFNGGLPISTDISSMLWAQPDIDAAADALRSLYRTHNEIKTMVDGPLRQGGMYERYRAESGEELLVKAWRDAAGGINHIVQVYGMGQPPRYPKIDSPSYDVKSPFYNEVTNLIFGVLAEDSSAHQLFFQPSLRVALALLDANQRDEAGRFEPLEQGENSAALKRISTLSWDKYPYSLILVPGYGPEEEKVRLSPKSKLVLAAVAHRFREGKAPLILVSGGYVHPTQTPFCEAVEMKKSLITDYGVPENAILIDPHARHTTTNMRNAARLIFRYGIPAEKDALITTTPSQIRYIDRPKFQERCTRELGYQPVQTGRRISPFDLEFRPLRDSLQSDPLDPLDP